ncbi:hypothetical protein BDV23DRAFT_168299 [Aspergillus alliaceus]|uniref:Uncharacterized protein n=1 Tax=Petromyces alliaceus TaxID=209559 RepID=A0A5N7CPF4_PETAA|nr:hypothetical protein BDV23DRAFT_168299 [Aspergillus alliaceus]
MTFSGLPRKKGLQSNPDRKSYLYYAQRRKLYLANSPMLPLYAPRTNVSAALALILSRFCSEACYNADVLLQNLTAADIKSWTLKRLYSMRNFKTIGPLIENNYINISLCRLPRPRPTEKVINLLYFQTTHYIYYNSVFANEKQRLYYTVGLNLSSVTACQALDSSLASKEALCNSGYKTNWSDKPGKLEDNIASIMSSDSSSSNIKSDIDYLSDYSSVTDDGYVKFYIIRHSVPKYLNILAAIITLLYTKKEDRKP